MMSNNTKKNDKKDPDFKWTNKNLAVISALVLIPCLVWLFYYSKKKNQIIQKPTIEANKSSPGKIAISNTEIAVARGLNYIAAMPSKTPINKQSKKLLMDVLKDPKIAAYFHFTLDFFGKTKGAFAAAKFVALMMRFDGSPENFHLMGKTKKELIENSKTLMDQLMSRRDQIAITPYFESRMLNLVHNLDVPPEKKIQFYSPTLAKAPKIDTDGGLSAESIGFETALILAKQSIKYTDHVLIESLLRSYAGTKNEEQQNAVKKRVAVYYPELRYIFPQQEL